MNKQFTRKRFQKPKPGFNVLNLLCLLFLLLFALLGNLQTASATQLNGSYTIDPSLPASATNFQNFNSALTYMTSYGGRTDGGPVNSGSLGVSGPVVFNVAAKTGNYNEQIIVTGISGLSSTNTLTFDGGAGNASTRVISFDATGTYAQHTVRLDNISYVRFRNLTIQSTNPNYGWPVNIRTGCTNIHFKKCIIQFAGTAASAATGNHITLAFSGDEYYYNGFSQINNIEIDSNQILGGYFAITAWSGNQSNVYDIKFRDNIIRDFYYYGIYVNFIQNMHIKHNIIAIRNSPNLNGYATYIINLNSGATTYNDFSDNEIYGNSYGLFLSSVGNPTNRGKMNNNIISGFKSNDNWGIQLQSCSKFDILHNSVNLEPVSTNATTACLYLSGCSGMDVRNNIFAVTGTGSLSIPVYSDNSNQYLKFDYNNYYKTGATNSTTLINNISPSLQVTKANLKGALGFNTNSTSVFPLFTSNNNLRLNNLGLSPFGEPGTGITTDIDGKTRCQLFPSIGASESPYIVSSQAGIKSDDTVFVNSPVNIFNTAVAGEPKIHTWTIDNAASTFNTLNISSYVFTSAGNYKVKLRTISCNGADSITKTIVAVVPKTPPVTSFLSDANNVDQGSLVQLSDFSTGGPSSWLWSASPSSGVQFIPGPNVQNPQVIFANVGTYNICLKASNDAGAGNLVCKSAYIIVTEANNLCGSKTITRTSSGKIFDAGGKTGDYGNNQNCSFLLDPCASAVTLSFNSFSLAAGDLLRIYDGKDASGVALHTGSGFTGSTLPTNLTSTSGKMFINMITNGTGVSSGFEAKWTSVSKPYNKPSAGFQAPDTLYTGTKFTFNSSSIGVDPDLSWDFNNDGVTDATDKNPSYTFSTPGTYIVRLSVNDCGGTDGAAKSILVIAPSTAPAPNFISNFSIISPGQTVSFYDRSTQAPNNWTWTVSPNTITYMDGTDSTSQNPHIKFNALGNYNVSLLAKNSFGQTSVTKTAFIRVVDYCFPGADLNTDIGITRVVFAGIDNVSNVGPQTYTDYTQSVQSANVQRGGKYAISLERTTKVEAMNRKVWIDFDGNGVFNNNELVASEPASKNLVWTDSVSIPVTANLGVIRMRIGTSYGISSNTPCGVNPYGEFEDYTVTIFSNLIKPVITLIGPSLITLEMGTPYTDQGATAMDDIQGNITNKIITSNNMNPNQTGTYFYRYSVSDNDGNSSVEVVRTVIITGDVTPPVLTVLGSNPLNIAPGGTYVDSGATAFDSFDGNITSRITVTGNVNPNVIGKYTLIYSVSDLAGHIVIKTRDVFVGDTEIPEIFVIGADTIYVNLGAAYNDPGAFVVDNFDKNLSYSVNLGVVNNQVVGSYLLTYTAADLSGNIAVSKSRVVIVRDITPPVLTLIDDEMVIEVFSVFDDPGFTVTDNYYSNITVTHTGTVNTSITDTYLLFYTAVDGSGNVSAVKTRKVKVVDSKSPVLSLNGSKFVNVCRWATYTDSGVTATDNYDPNPFVTVRGQVNTLQEGMYSLVYTAIDNSGNKVESERFVRVIACNIASGIDSKTNLNFSVFPNPTDGKLNIQVNRKDLSRFEIVVKDMLGRTIHAAVNKNISEGTAELNFENEAAGMYFITVTVNNELLVQKIKVIK